MTILSAMARPYAEFCNTLKGPGVPSPSHGSIITFNYDLALDVDLNTNGFNIHYTLDFSGKTGRTIAEIRVHKRPSSSPTKRAATCSCSHIR
jgi:hypothetical protein